MRESYKIKSLTVKSFRGISYESTLYLKDITILCGENGTGKSSFVNAFQYIFTNNLDFFALSTIDKEKVIANRFINKEDMDIQIEFNNSKILKLGEEVQDDELNEILNHQFVKNSSFILNPERLFNFIGTTRANRYNALIELCGFHNLVKHEKIFLQTLMTMNQYLLEKINELEKDVIKLSNILVSNDSLSLEESMEELNLLLKNNHLKQIYEDTNISKYLLDFQFESKNQLKDQINDFNRIYDSLKNKNYLEQDIHKNHNIDYIYSDLDELIKEYEYLDQNNKFNKSRWKDDFDLIINKLSNLNNYLENIEDIVLNVNNILKNNEKDYEGINHEKFKKISLYLINFNFKKEKSLLRKLISDLYDLLYSNKKIEIDKKLFNNINKKIDRLQENLYDSHDLTKNSPELLIIYESLFVLDKIENLYSQIKDLENKNKIIEVTYETFKESKQEFINNVIQEIRNDLKSFYNFIHEDDVLSSPDIKLINNRSIDLYLESFGELVDPRAYASQGHLDSLALCIFLAFNKKFNIFPLIILDDVIATVDLTHKERIARLLVEEFEDFQIFIATHSKLWNEQLRRLTNLSPKSLKSYEIIMWNKEEGPILAEPINIEDKIEKYLSKDNYDLNAAGNTARRYLEYILKQICRTNRLKIPYVNQPDLNSFFTRAMADTKKAVKDTPLEEYYKEVWDDLNKLRFMANYSSHDNINFNEVSYSEVKSFCGAVINLRKAVTCNNDGNFLIFDKTYKRLNCSGNNCRESLDMNSF